MGASLALELGGARVRVEMVTLIWETLFWFMMIAIVARAEIYPNLCMPIVLGTVIFAAIAGPIIAKWQLT